MIPADVRRQLDYLIQGFTPMCGEFTLATSGTTTTVSKRGVSASSCVTPVPFNDGARTEGNLKIVPTKDSFEVTHTVSASPARTYRYVVHTPTS